MKTTRSTPKAPKRPEEAAGQGTFRRWWAGISAALALLLVGLGVAAAYWSQQPESKTKMETEKTEAKLQPAPINGQRAFGYLKQICEIGPRPAGSEANAKQLRMVAEHFEKMGGVVKEQPFHARDPISNKPLQMANLIGSWFPDRTARILIAAHYDTRPYPDQETDPRRRKDPFIGANDCASGVALLMEIAHHLNDLPTEWGVDLILLDGEELVYDRVGEYFLGSKEFGRVYRSARRSGKQKWFYAGGILLDMIGGKNLDLPREQYSERFAPGLLDDVWNVAHQLGESAFRDAPGPAILDDHLALNDAGIPTIDIIDFSYPHWHTASDLPENCDPASLVTVGRVVTAWLTKPKPTDSQR